MSCFSLMIFQSTLPRRERRCHPQSGVGGQGISIHAPAQGATRAESIDYGEQDDFNPRSRAGSDQLRGDCPLDPHISIHAPAQGATGNIIHENNFCVFQSTLPRRERRHRKDQGLSRPAISIHAPAQGATAACFLLPLSQVFQSTLPRRERLEFYYTAGLRE